MVPILAKAQMSLRPIGRICALSLPLVLGGCFDLTGLDEMFGAPLLGIAVEGAIVEVGDTVRVTAMGDAGGIIGIFAYDPLPDARWTISPQSVAQLQALPPPPPDDSFPRARTLVRGLSVGSALVEASARGITGRATVRVIPAIGTLQLTASRATLGVGDTLRVEATALDVRGAPITGLPITYTVTGGLQLRGSDDTGARFVGTEPGPATVSAMFRRAKNEVAVVVIARTEP